MESQDSSISRVRELLFRGLVAGAATLFTVLVVEVGLRLSRDDQRFYPYHPNSIKVIYPSEEITPGVYDTSYFTTNSYGTRGPELQGQPIRILTVGGSTTACTALNDDETWPHVLNQSLNERGEDDLVWVTNSGMDGQNSHHHLMHVKYLLPKLPRIDYVLIYAGLNDVGMWLYRTDMDPHYLDDADNWASRVGEAFRISNYTPAQDPAYKRLELWKRASILKDRYRTRMVEEEREQGRIIQDSHLGWMRREARRRNLAEKRFVHRAKMETLPAALDSYQETLERIIDHVRRAGAQPIFVAQAMDHNILSEEERKRRWMGAMDGEKTYVKEEQMRELLQDYNERMRETAEANSVLYIDLPELLRNERGLFIDGHHFNEYGGRVVGVRLADTLWSMQLEPDVANRSGRADQ